MRPPARERRRTAFDRGLAAALRHAVYAVPLPPLAEAGGAAEQLAYRTARDLTLQALDQVRKARP